MGVMGCFRKGCDNIMCNHYNTEIGYICYECLSELKEIQKYKPNMKVKHIVKFMNTPKIHKEVDFEDKEPKIDLDEFFSSN